ncbi:MAG: oligoendopeptidase F [Clostridia bacterium]|nr:oligoendopeptidase F [Clostridia bacterium]
MADKIRKREEIPEEFKWDLSAIFPSDEAWEKECEAVRRDLEKYGDFKGKLGEDPASLLGFFKLSDDLNVRVSKIYGYASCSSDGDTANSFYQNMSSKGTSVYVAMNAARSFATPEITAIPQDTLDRFFEEEPELETYRRLIEYERKLSEHVLSAECESILASAGEMARGPENIASVFRNADIRFPSVKDEKGEEHELTGETLVPLLQNEDRTLRENAFREFYNTYRGFRNTVASTLDANFKSLVFFSRARKFETTLDAALSNTEVPAAVYRNLIASVRANLDKMYRYVALRKKMLGVDELHMYDVYVPLVAGSSKKIPFEEAKSTVLDALSVLGEDYTDMLKEGFRDRWIDVYQNVGKRGGAYSSGSPYPHPYVLLNHTDDLESMFTLAHEMGHALHSYLSLKNQPTCTNDYVIFVAEVASTCNEILLMRYLLGKTDDKKERMALVNHFLDSFKGTVFRQTMFAEFELFMGEKAEAGEALTADLLDGKYLELNKLYFGPDMISDPGIALEWARIPHFFYNYYVFQYATGFSAAAAIAERILKEGKPAVEDYKRFLSGGFSADPVSLLKIAGVDMSTPGPVNSALSLFGDLVDEMERLASEQ